MNFSRVETAACRQLVQLALAEDLADVGDLTSKTLLSVAAKGCAVFVARSAGVLAGLEAIALVLTELEPRPKFHPLLEDGMPLTADSRIATVEGPMVSILAAERTALNFVQRLSGIATQTRKYAEAVAGLPCCIMDTRKTTPGWRVLEKYAVRCGGGNNHRMGLHDGVLIKDNHLAALGGGPSSIARAVQAARQRVGHTVPIEIEVDNLDQFDAALAEKPDIILLDNMSLDHMREAVRRRGISAPDVQLEASGGVTLETVRAAAQTGVDRISVGALTHSAPALDIALDYLP